LKTLLSADQGIVSYLPTDDFIGLGTVSRAFRVLIGPTTVRGNRIVNALLKIDSLHYSANGDVILYEDQSPVVGYLTLEQSIQQHPITVAK
jgi:hypothetical protein